VARPRLQQLFAWATVAALVLLLVAGGCGGGEETNEEAAAPTKRQFLREAHAVCYRFSKKQVRHVEAFTERHGLDPAEPDQRERERLIAAVVIPAAEGKLEELKKLQPPQGDEKKVETLLRAIEKGIRDAEAHPAWLAAPTPAHEQPFEHGMELWLDYGDWLCGQAGG
jgi:hypothetical protein